MKKQSRRRPFDEADQMAIKLVVSALETEYQLEPANARDLMQRSHFLHVLQDDPLYVQHYSADYWAKDIIRFHSEISAI